MDSNPNSHDLSVIKLSKEFTEVGVEADIVSWRIQNASLIVLDKMKVKTGDARTCKFFFHSTKPLYKEKLFMCAISVNREQYTQKVISLINFIYFKDFSFYQFSLIHS